MSWNLVHMKDTPRPHILLKFQPKIWKSLVIGTCPKLLYIQKTQSGPLGVKSTIFLMYNIIWQIYVQKWVKTQKWKKLYIVHFRIQFAIDRLLDENNPRRVIARNIGPILCLNWNDIVLLRYKFWIPSPKNMKFLLEMPYLMLIRSLIF